MKILRAFCGSLLLPCAASWACGVCVEDKVAATYDHAVIQQAAGKGQVVVFCEASGAIDAPRIRNAARLVRGLDRSSVRVSTQPAALSFAIDPAQQSPQAAVSALQKALPAGSHVAILKLMTPQR